jgi:hypothetical protein
MTVEYLEELQEWAKKNIGGIHGMMVPGHIQVTPAAKRFAKREDFKIMVDRNKPTFSGDRFKLRPRYLT